jgi:hypothetical protein
MYCTQCGAENSAGSTSCSRCHAVLYVPGSAQAPQSQDKAIPNHLLPSILVTLCCCQVPGIVAIVYAAQVNALIRAGDFAGARRCSRLAATWMWVAFGLGLLVGVIYGVAVLAGAATAR